MLFRSHHTIAGATFLVDHPFLGDLYSAYEDAYDGVVERIIGLGQKIDIPTTGLDAAKTAAAWSKVGGMNDWPRLLLDVESEIRKEIATLMKHGLSDGTQNFLQGIADESEVRSYKLRQRNGGK